MSAAQLKARLVTAAQAGLPSPATDVKTDRIKSILTASQTFDLAGGLSIFVVIEAAASDTVARQTVKLDDMVYGTSLGAGYRSLPLHIGDASIEHAGTDRYTKSDKIEIDLAKGRVFASLTISRVDDRPGALPPSARVAIERAARAQVALLP